MTCPCSCSLDPEVPDISIVLDISIRNDFCEGIVQHSIHLFTWVVSFTTFPGLSTTLLDHSDHASATIFTSTAAFEEIGICLLSKFWWSTHVGEYCTRARVPSSASTFANSDCGSSRTRKWLCAASFCNLCRLRKATEITKARRIIDYCPTYRVSPCCSTCHFANTTGFRNIRFLIHTRPFSSTRSRSHEINSGSFTSTQPDTCVFSNSRSCLKSKFTSSNTNTGLVTNTGIAFDLKAALTSIACRCSWTRCAIAGDWRGL